MSVPRLPRWEQLTTHLGPGVDMAHRGSVLGEELRLELVMRGNFSLQIRLNGQDYGPPLVGCTLSGARRQYRALLRRLERPQQKLLPI